MSTEDPEEQRLFPADNCVPVLAELNAWTSVPSILTAARYLEDRDLPSDQVEGRLIMPMRHGPLFEAVFNRAISWMIVGYRVPDVKIALAQAVDPTITVETVSRLRAARFAPTIRSVPLRAFDNSVDPPPNGPNAFLIDDEPIVIELLQTPLRCLMDILTFSFKNAERLHDLRAKAKQVTGSAPTIFHRPYADSRLYATLEALCYYAHGLEIGPFALSAGSSDIDISYRAVNVRARPPIDTRLLAVAKESMEGILSDLR
nr:hypothetical protein NG677_17195 [Methylobacterium sp. OTU13CASTA1]